MYSSLSEREEWLGKEIVDAAFKVHRELGPGLLEKIYEACLKRTTQNYTVLTHKNQISYPILPGPCFGIVTNFMRLLVLS